MDRHAVNVLLVGQTLPQVRVITGGVPTRPSQNSPERVAKWQQARAVVGSSIRTLRLAKGMTQEALALRSEVTRNVLIDVEHGKRGLLFERLVDIAEALEVEPGALFNGSAGVFRILAGHRWGVRRCRQSALITRSQLVFGSNHARLGNGLSIVLASGR